MRALRILKLRQRAQTELGDKYDIRAFHDEILNGGRFPSTRWKPGSPHGSPRRKAARRT